MTLTQRKIQTKYYEILKDEILFLLDLYNIRQYVLLTCA